MSTLIFATSLLGLLAASLVLWALFLRLGLWWAKVKDVTTGRIVLAVVLAVVLQLTLSIVLQFAPAASPVADLLRRVLELAAAVLIPCLAIMAVFKTSFFRAVQAWLPTLLATAVSLAFALLVLRPFLFEAFVSPTNAMAPTLLGNHWQGTCTECGAPAFCSPIPPEYAFRAETPLMICRDNFHLTQPADVGNRVFRPDRFVVAKFLKPRRWDLVAFHFPEDLSALYVMRLVGLPGEEITIRDGCVWANGEKLEPPDSLHGIEYAAELQDVPWDLWGTPDRPAQLGEGEYFVLGDFSPQSKDSRLWQRGAPGHPSFAVPESHFYGVVTHTFWPPERWRVFR
jgi:signal peptidase I